MKQKIMLAVLILAILGVLTIAKNYDLTDSEEKKNLMDTVFGWAKRISGNIVSITTYSLEKQWLPANKTIEDREEAE